MNNQENPNRLCNHDRRPMIDDWEKRAKTLQYLLETSKGELIQLIARGDLFSEWHEDTIVKLTTQIKEQAGKLVEPERLWCKDEDLGEYYTPICPNCKNELKPLNNFCSHCGSPLDWSKNDTGN